MKPRLLAVSTTVFITLALSGCGAWMRDAQIRAAVEGGVPCRSSNIEVGDLHSAPADVREFEAMCKGRHYICQRPIFNESLWSCFEEEVAAR